MQLCVVTTDQALKTKRDALKKFVAAYAEAKNILMTDDQIWPELAKEVNLKGDEEVGLLKKNLQSSYVQTWNKSFIDSELKLNYEIADLQKGVKFIPDKIPEGFFSFLQEAFFLSDFFFLHLFCLVKILLFSCLLILLMAFKYYYNYCRLFISIFNFK